MEREQNLHVLMSQYWSKISEEDLAKIEGQEEKLTELIQERYQCSRVRATRDIRRFFEKYRGIDANSR